MRGNHILTKEAARKIVNQIHDRGIKYEVDTRRDLLDLYDGEGWAALGYKSWIDCGRAEFANGRGRIYQLLDAALIQENLSTRVDVQNNIPECYLRPLAVIRVQNEAGEWVMDAEAQSEVWNMANETAPDGKLTKKHVELVVKRFLHEKAKSKTWKFKPPRTVYRKVTIESKIMDLFKNFLKAASEELLVDEQNIKEVLFVRLTEWKQRQESKDESATDGDSLSRKGT